MDTLKELAEKWHADDPEDTSEAEKDEIDAQAVRNLLHSHQKFDPPHPRCEATPHHLEEIACWVLAMPDCYEIERRRVAAQKLVAAHTEPSEHAKKRMDDEDDDDDQDETITPQAVQGAVTRQFKDRSETPQQFFDEILKDIEESYQHLEDNR